MFPSLHTKPYVSVLAKILAHFIIFSHLNFPLFPDPKQCKGEKNLRFKLRFYFIICYLSEIIALPVNK